MSWFSEQTFPRFGQVEALEWILRPGPQGFFKRLQFAIAPDRIPVDDAVETDHSMGFYQYLHDCMFSHPYVVASYLHLDGQALTLFRTVLRAVSDWLEAKESEGVKVSRWFAIKLGFTFSDLLRSACVNMRMVQSLERQAGKLKFDVSRTSINPEELMAGFHGWMRCLELHAGLYRYWAGKPAVSSDVTGRSVPDRLEDLSGDSVKAQPLGTPEKTKHDMVKFAKTLEKPFTQGDFRVSVKDKMPYRKMSGLSDAIAAAATGLVDVNLMHKVDAPEGASKQKAKMPHYSLAAWSSFSEDEGAIALCNACRLNRDDFP